MCHEPVLVLICALLGNAGDEAAGKHTLWFTRFHIHHSDLRCGDCATYVHPPSPVCPECLSRKLAPAAVSGSARLLTWTENHHPWIPGFDPPYLIAIVEILEQPGLRITTNLVNCQAESLRADLPVQVVFEERDDGVFLPLFEPRRPPQ